MDKDYLKTSVNILINNKSIFSNMLIITLGGTIGLFLKAINVSTNFFEVLLMITGTILTVFLTFIILNISEKINELLLNIKVRQE